MTKPKAKSGRIRPLNDEDLKSAAGGMASVFMCGDTAIVVSADATSHQVLTIKATTT